VRYAVGDWIKDDGDRPVATLNGITLALSPKSKRAVEQRRRRGEVDSVGH
jgi:hypothetical protein